MATTILAGNATNGLALTPDSTGILELKTGTGAGTTALTLNASQNATFAGTVTSSTGALYPLVSGTVNAGGTNPFPSSAGPATVDFTGIPPTAKRITVMFSGVSLSGTSNYLIQIGSGGFTSSGYASASATIQSSGNTILTSSSGFAMRNAQVIGATVSGIMTITLISGTTYVASHALGDLSQTSVVSGGGTSASLSGVLDRIRITTVNGTDLFDLGSINILWE